MTTLFDRSYIPEPTTGCWLWLGVVVAGYGRLPNSHRGR